MKEVRTCETTSPLRDKSNLSIISTTKFVEYECVGVI